MTEIKKGKSEKFTTRDLRGDFYRVENQIFDFNLSVYEIGVYNCLCRFSNNTTQKCFPSINKIAKMLKIGRTKVIESIKLLVDSEIIVKSQGEKGSVNSYYLLSLSGVVRDTDGGSPPDGRGVVREADTNNTNDLNNTKKEKHDPDFLYLLPKELNTADFIEVWKQWVKYRKERKKKLVESTVLYQLKELNGKTPQIAAAMIVKSIKNGWVGIFPLKPGEEVNPDDLDPYTSKWNNLK